MRDSQRSSNLLTSSRDRLEAAAKWRGVRECVATLIDGHFWLSGKSDSIIWSGKRDSHLPRILPCLKLSIRNLWLCSNQPHGWLVYWWYRLFRQHGHYPSRRRRRPFQQEKKWRSVTRIYWIINICWDSVGFEIFIEFDCFGIQTCIKEGIWMFYGWFYIGTQSIWKINSYYRN